ncbi:uncharacterized protein ACR2FA_003230 [Aphomia sociella]
MVRIITEKLKIPGFTVEDISRSQRVGHSVSDKPRPILVKFRDLAMKNRVWFAKSALKDSGLTLSEFLTKERHEAFIAARRHFGVQRCWTRDGGVIIIAADGTKHRVISTADVKKLIASLPPEAEVAPEAVGSTVSRVPAAATSRVRRPVRK